MVTEVEPVGRFEALIVLDDVLVLEELDHFDFAVEKLAQKLVRDMEFRHNLNGNHRFMVVGDGELKARSVNVSCEEKVFPFCESKFTLTFE